MAICHYETAKHPLYDHEEAAGRGFRPRGTLVITQKSGSHQALLEWKVSGLRPYCWTEGHLHYNGDRHEKVLGTWAELENVHSNYQQKNHGVNEYDRNGKDRHTGDITLLRADKDGNAEFKRYDEYISLFGNHSIIGRMGDLHFPKSCYYPGGWDGELNPYKDNVGPDKNNSNIEDASAKNDPQGRHSNDKRGISFCVVGQVSSEDELPDEKWDKIKV